MFDIVRKEMGWGGETLTLETGKMARQAYGSVLATYGETTVLATVVYPLYLVWLILQGWTVWLFVMVVSTAAYSLLSLLALIPMAVLTTRVERPWSYAPAALLSPFYKGLLRWVRLAAYVLELAKVKSNDPFLPDAVWANAPPI